MHALENLEDLSAQGHGQGLHNNAERHVHGISDRIMCLQSSLSYDRSVLYGFSASDIFVFAAEATEL